MSASGVTEGVLTPGDSMALRDSSNPVGISHAGGDGVSQSEETGEMAAALEAAQAERQALERDKAALEQQAAQQQVRYQTQPGTGTGIVMTARLCPCNTACPGMQHNSCMQPSAQCKGLLHCCNDAA
jgi:hypothetical protein